ncbi:DUF2177 family protein [Candidatus Woesearchaeota archaeon]|jgi:uncharacterized membrane protein|nr:DUF2177 family protein [Candidatus Woesearchaeota archaeon]
MAILNYLKIFILTFIFLVIVDALWLKFGIGSFFQKTVKHLLAFRADGSMQVNIVAALCVWAVMVIGLLIFVLPRLSLQGWGGDALLYGALFGFVSYAIYDLTNFATLNNWPAKLVVLDVAWGTFVCALTSFVMNHLAKWLM